MTKIIFRLVKDAHRKIALCLLAGVTTLFAMSAPLLGQATGSILGTVTDPTGAVVVNAQIALTSTDHGDIRTAKTNEKGEYQFTTLAVGTYNLVIQAPLFQTLNALGIAVDADKNVLFDGKLTPGGASSEVTVSGTINTVETQTATLQVLIDPELVHNLPIDRNNVVALASLLPGVSNVSAPTTFVNDTGGPTYNVSGARSNQNLFLLDGTLWNNLYSNTGLNFPPPDALTEVSVLLNNFKAQYGRNAGSVFSVLTRSGTNAVRVNGFQQATIALRAGSATYTFTPQAGTYAVSGQYSGDINYASSSASVTVTVIPAPTTNKLSYSGAPLSTSGNQVANYILMANITSTVPVIGVVNFYSGTALLGSAPINNKGIATLILYDTNVTPGTPPFIPSQPTASAFILQNPTFTASYTGGANFAPSMSNPVTVSGDMGLALLTSTLAAPQGYASNTFLIVTPYLGLTGTVSFTCSGLPANSLCRFLPNSLPFPQPMPTYTSIEDASSNFGLGNYYPAGGAGVIQIQLYTNKPSDLAEVHPLRNLLNTRRARGSAEAGFTVFSGFIFLAWRKRRTPLGRKLFMWLLFAAAPLLAGGALSGCSGTAYYDYPQLTTPVGTYTITVVATSSNGTVESIPVTLQVGTP